MAIPVSAGIRGFAGIPVPAKFHFFAGIPYRDFLTCQKIKIVEFGVKLTSYFENRGKYQNSVHKNCGLQPKEQLCQVSASGCGKYSQLRDF